MAGTETELDDHRSGRGVGTRETHELSVKARFSAIRLCRGAARPDRSRAPLQIVDLHSHDFRQARGSRQLLGAMHVPASTGHHKPRPRHDSARPFCRARGRLPVRQAQRGIQFQRRSCRSSSVNAPQAGARARAAPRARSAPGPRRRLRAACAESRRAAGPGRGRAPHQVVAVDREVAHVERRAARHHAGYPRLQLLQAFEVGRRVPALGQHVGAIQMRTDRRAAPTPTRRIQRRTAASVHAARSRSGVPDERDDALALVVREAQARRAADRPFRRRCARARRRCSRSSSR